LVEVDENYNKIMRGEEVRWAKRVVMGRKEEKRESRNV